MKNFNNDRGFKSFDNRGFGDNKQKRFGRSQRSFGRNRGGSDRQMYEAICDKCGKSCQLPFMPTGEKPVYCSDCFEKNSGDSGKRRFDNKSEMEVINQKLDKILELLTATKPIKKVKKITTEEAKN